MSDFIIAYAPTKRKDYFAKNPYNFFNLPDFAAFWAKKWWDIPKKRPRRAGALSFRRRILCYTINVKSWLNKRRRAAGKRKERKR